MQKVRDRLGRTDKVVDRPNSTVPTGDLRTRPICLRPTGFSCDRMNRLHLSDSVRDLRESLEIGVRQACDLQKTEKGPKSNWKMERCSPILKGIPLESWARGGLAPVYRCQSSSQSY